MRANDFRPDDPTRHGAYLCLDSTSIPDRPAAAATVAALQEHLGLDNEHAANGHPTCALAFLRRAQTADAAIPGQIEDAGLLRADAVVHVAAPTVTPVRAFLDALGAALGAAVCRTLTGVVRPTVFTSNATHNLAYAQALLQQPASTMPHAFLLPTSKTAEWWRKDWMERHTYFLPRYAADGRRENDGHPLSAAEGVDWLMRRTYKQAVEPAAPGDYDFVNYFECSDAGVPVFHRVCAALRDRARNPEWAFVREGPTWRGRRVATWDELVG